ncbi:MAG: EVE domain-containing protein [Gudongella sp.]|nr:EVE domain-containing protein [Gudongella sp.]
MGENIIKPTGYWSFICQPKKWDIDKFFEEDITRDTYQIDNWQKEWFEAGQLGIIRVSKDKRTKVELEGRKKLDSGVYAIVRILGKPYRRGDSKSKFWTDDSYIDPDRYIVDIEYLKKINTEPILIDNLKMDIKIKDKYLINGWQGSSVPLTKESFREILIRIEATDFLLESINTIKSINGILNVNGRNGLEDETTLEEILETDFQNKTEKYFAEDYEIRDEKKQKEVPLVLGRGTYFPRSIKVAKRAIVDANYLCELDSNHKDFLSKTSCQNYVEAHHLIPMEFQNEFDYSIDVEANIISLCAVCHKLLHHANLNDKKDKITKLYYIREKRLRECGLKIELDKLINYYK